MAAGMATWTVALSAGWVLAAVNYPDDVIVPIGPVAILSLALGGFLWLRVPGNLIGPILFVSASAGLIYDTGTAYALYSLDNQLDVAGVHMAAWLGVWTLPLFYASFCLLLALFPDGRFDGHRRIFLAILALVITLVGIGAVRLWSYPAEVLTDQETLDVLPAYEIMNPAFVLSFLLMFPLAVGSLVYRFIRGSSAVRQQIKLILVAAVLVPPSAWAVARFTGDTVDEWVMAVALCAAPITIAFAVLRYRIYDIDRLVSRSVSYVLVVGLLGGVFAVGVVLLPNLVTGLEDSPLLVAGSTLLVAAMFNPLRKRVQAWVARRFNRAKYDAERVMDQFATTLRDQTDDSSVVDGWVGVVSETMNPSSVGVWVREMH